MTAAAPLQQLAVGPEIVHEERERPRGGEVMLQGVEVIEGEDLSPEDDEMLMSDEDLGLDESHLSFLRRELHELRDLLGSAT